MNYAVEMGSGATKYKFHKDLFIHSKFDRWSTQIHKQHGNRISLLSFFEIRKVGLKKSYNHKHF
jgi:hypothetical protein